MQAKLFLHGVKEGSCSINLSISTRRAAEGSVYFTLRPIAANFQDVRSMYNEGY